MKSIARIQEIASILPPSLMDEAEELFELSSKLKEALKVASETLTLCSLLDKSGQAKKAAEMIDNVIWSDMPQKEEKYQPTVTVGWDGYPTILLEGGKVFPRGAELIFNKKYYPKGIPGEWPVDPDTGEKLPVAKREDYS